VEGEVEHDDLAVSWKLGTAIRWVEGKLFRECSKIIERKPPIEGRKRGWSLAEI
jgi:hypothetical protein